jgi:hypothetical protein
MTPPFRRRIRRLKKGIGCLRNAVRSAVATRSGRAGPHGVLTFVSSISIGTVLLISSILTLNLLHSSILNLANLLQSPEPTTTPSTPHSTFPILETAAAAGSAAKNDIGSEHHDDLDESDPESPDESDPDLHFPLSPPFFFSCDHLPVWSEFRKHLLDFIYNHSAEKGKFAVPPMEQADEHSEAFLRLFQQANKLGFQYERQFVSTVSSWDWFHVCHVNDPRDKEGANLFRNAEGQVI